MSMVVGFFSEVSIPLMKSMSSQEIGLSLIIAGSKSLKMEDPSQ
jgi:hypothetical protein